MKVDKSRNWRCLISAVACCVTLLLPFGFTNTSGESSGLSSVSPETLRLGERMYREGVLPSGKPMQAIVAGNPPVPGTAFACVSCHQRSGLGLDEENVYAPATTGAKLFQPLQMRYLRYGMENPTYFAMPIDRPAYTDASLAEALRNGTG